jgi:hypothetical protein
MIPALGFTGLALGNGAGSLWMPVATTTLAALFIAHVVDALRTGSAAARYRDVTRNQNPVGFYAAVAFHTVMGGLSMAVAAEMWLQWLRRLP